MHLSHGSVYGIKISAILSFWLEKGRGILVLKSYFGEDLMNDNKKKKNGYRLDIVLIVSFFVMLISFCAYMMNTTLEEVLENETGSSVVTHDYTYESAESSSAA